MPRCSVASCKRRSTSTHYLPKDEVRRAQWIEFIRQNKPEFKPTLYASICGAHFENSCFTRNYVVESGTGFKSKRRILHDDAIPTLVDPPSLPEGQTEWFFASDMEIENPNSPIIKASNVRFTDQVTKIAPVTIASNGPEVLGQKMPVMLLPKTATKSVETKLNPELKPLQSYTLGKTLNSSSPGFIKLFPSKQDEILNQIHDDRSVICSQSQSMPGTNVIISTGTNQIGNAAFQTSIQQKQINDTFQHRFIMQNEQLQSATISIPSSSIAFQQILPLPKNTVLQKKSPFSTISIPSNNVIANACLKKKLQTQRHDSDKNQKISSRQQVSQSVDENAESFTLDEVKRMSSDELIKFFSCEVYLKNSLMKAISCKMGGANLCPFIISCPTLTECIYVLRPHMKKHIQWCIDATIKDPSMKFTFPRVKKDKLNSVSDDSTAVMKRHLGYRKLKNKQIPISRKERKCKSQQSQNRPKRKANTDQKYVKSPKKYTLSVNNRPLKPIPIAAKPTQHYLTVILQPSVNLLDSIQNLTSTNTTSNHTSNLKNICTQTSNSETNIISNLVSENEDVSHDFDMPIITKICGSAPRETPESELEQSEIEKQNESGMDADDDSTPMFISSGGSKDDSKKRVKSERKQNLHIKTEPSNNESVNFNCDLISEKSDDVHEISSDTSSMETLLLSRPDNGIFSSSNLQNLHLNNKTDDQLSVCDDCNSQLDIQENVELNQNYKDSCTDSIGIGTSSETEKLNNIFSLFDEGPVDTETTSNDDTFETALEFKEKRCFLPPSNKRSKNNESIDTQIVDYGNIFENIQLNLLDTPTNLNYRINPKFPIKSPSIDKTVNNFEMTTSAIMENEEAFLSILGLQKVSETKLVSHEDENRFVVKPPRFRTRLQKKAAVLERSVRKANQEVTTCRLTVKSDSWPMSMNPTKQIIESKPESQISKSKLSNRRHLQRRASLNNFLLNRLHNTPAGPCATDYHDIKGYNLRRANLLKKRAHDQAKLKPIAEVNRSADNEAKQPSVMFYNPVGEVTTLPVEGLLQIYEEEREYAKKMAEGEENQLKLRKELELKRKKEEEEKWRKEEQLQIETTPVEELVPPDKIILKRKLFPPCVRSPSSLPRRFAPYLHEVDKPSSPPLAISKNSKKRKRRRSHKTIPPPRNITVNGKVVCIKHEPMTDDESVSNTDSSDNECDDEINVTAKKPKLTVSNLLFQRRKNIVKPSDVLLDIQSRSSSETDDSENYNPGDEAVSLHPARYDSDQETDVEPLIIDQSATKENRLIEIEREVEDIEAPLLTDQDIAIIGFTNDHTYHRLKGEKIDRVVPSMASHTNNSKDKGKDAEKQAAINAYELQEREDALEHLRHLKYTENSRVESSTAGGTQIDDLCCRICDRRFTATHSLYYHYRSHAGVKPFKCDICFKSFTRLHSLNYHKMIHDNKTRFQCRYCGRGFRHPTHYKEHLNKHTGEEPFECTMCGRGFKTSNTLRRHRRRNNCLKDDYVPTKKIPLSLSVVPEAPIRIISNSPPLPESPPPPALPIRPFVFPQSKAVKLVLFPKNGISRVGLYND